MTARSFYRWLPLFALALGSCKDPALVRKREEQQTEIKRLEGEIALIQEKLKDLPPDRGAELAEARKTHEAQSQEIARLEQEVSGLETRKRQLEREFAQYRVKYPLKNN
jgi:hypothetical protein